VSGENIKHYARLVATPVEYLVRLESAVRRSLTWSHGTEYSAIRDKIIELCDACKSKIFDDAVLFRKIYTEDDLGDQILSTPDELAVRALLRSTAGTFTALHELLLFLPRESIRPELRAYCECLFRDEFQSTELSLILTSLFNAFEYSLDDVMRFLEADVFKFKIPDPKALSFGNVMELAIVDRNNPLAWAVLAHEFGHFLDHHNGLTKRAVQEFSSKSATPYPDEFIRALERLCTEIVADLTGYYLHGPCSILPLVNMSILIGCIQEPPIKFDGEHGAPTTRIEMVRKLCAEDNISITRITPQLDTLIVEEGQKEAALPPEERERRTLIHGFLTEFFDQVRPVILAELGRRSFTRFTAEHYRRANVLSDRLALGLPIGASRMHEDEKIADALHRAAGNPKSLRDEYSLLEEQAASVSEVITAGWIHRVEHTPSLYGQSFTQSTQEGVFTSIASGLERQDELLFKSIAMIPMLESFHAPTR